MMTNTASYLTGSVAVCQTDCSIQADDDEKKVYAASAHNSPLSVRAQDSVMKAECLAPG